MYESLHILQKVVTTVREWTRGQGLTDEQVAAINSYYSTLKDCDYLGE